MSAALHMPGTRTGIFTTRAGRTIMEGDRVRHRGTLAWGVVLEVWAQRDGTAELVVQRDKPPYEGASNAPTTWATYHLDYAAMEAER